jgi:hypothetical protein
MGEAEAAWTPPAATADAPMACALPMDVRTLLFRHGRCPDPRRDDASKASDWVVRQDWFFATAFECAPPAGGTRVFLRTRGVDDLAEFRLNGGTNALYGEGLWAHPGRTWEGLLAADGLMAIPLQHYRVLRLDGVINQGMHHRQ